MKPITKVLLGAGSALVVLVIAAVAALFFFMSGSEHEKMIPADAEMVWSVNVSDLAENAGLSDKEMSDKMDELLDNAPADVAELIRELSKEPKELGIRLDKPAYFWFSNKNKCFGFAVGLHNADKFKESLKKVEGASGSSFNFDEEDGVTWVEVDGMSEFERGNVAIAYTGKSLIVGAGENSKRRVKNWMKLEKDDMYCKTDRFSRLKDIEGQVKCDLYLSKNLCKELMERDRSLKRAFEPFGKHGVEIGYTCGLNVQKGYMELNAQAYSDNETIQKMLDKYPGMDNINGKYAKNVPSDYVFWCAMNINSQEYMEALKSSKGVKEVLNKFKDSYDIDLVKFLSGIKGDVAFHVAGPFKSTADDILPDFTLRGEVSDDKFVSRMVDKCIEMSPSINDIIRKDGKNEYTLMKKHWNWADDTYEYSDMAFFGQADGTAYISSKKESRKLGNTSDVLSDYASEMKSSVAFAVFTPKNLLPLLKEDIDGREYWTPREDIITYNLLSQMKDVTLSVKQGGKVNVRCNFADGNATLSKAITKIAEDSEVQIKQKEKEIEELREKRRAEEEAAYDEYDW